MVPMARKELMISGLRKQRDILKELMRLLEGKMTLGGEDCDLYDKVTLQVEKNLRNLRGLVSDEVADCLRSSDNE